MRQGNRNARWKFRSADALPWTCTTPRSIVRASVVSPRRTSTNARAGPVSVSAASRSSADRVAPRALASVNVACRPRSGGRPRRCRRRPQGRATTRPRRARPFPVAPRRRGSAPEELHAEARHRLQDRHRVAAARRHGVDGARRGRRQLARRDEARRRRAACRRSLRSVGEIPGELRAQVGEPPVAEQQLAQDEERPAVADEVERARDRTVLPVRRLAAAGRCIRRRAVRRRRAPRARLAARVSRGTARPCRHAARASAAATARTRCDAASAASASAPTTGASRTATFLWYGVAAIGSQSSCAVIRFRRGPSTMRPPCPSGYDWP